MANASAMNIAGMEKGVYSKAGLDGLEEGCLVEGYSHNRSFRPGAYGSRCAHYTPDFFYRTQCFLKVEESSFSNRLLTLLVQHNFWRWVVECSR